MLFSISPSCIDLSGRHEHPPLSSAMGDSPVALHRGLMGDLPRPVPPSHELSGRASKRGTPESRADEGFERSVRRRGGPIFGGAPHSERPDGQSKVTFSRSAPVDEPTNSVTCSTSLWLAQQESGAPGASIKVPRVVNTITDSKWKIGAYFRHTNRRGLAHRVYDGPPDGTIRDRIGPEILMVDFERPYKIVALFMNDLHFSVQFKVPGAVMMSGWKTRSRVVWGNVRRGSDWWATLVHPDPAYIRDQESDDDNDSADNKTTGAMPKHPVGKPEVYGPTSPSSSAGRGDMPPPKLPWTPKVRVQVSAED